jgi:hypothetical protein
MANKSYEFILEELLPCKRPNGYCPWECPHFWEKEKDEEGDAPCRDCEKIFPENAHAAQKRLLEYLVEEGLLIRDFESPESRKIDELLKEFGIGDNNV